MVRRAASGGTGCPTVTGLTCLAEARMMQGSLSLSLSLYVCMCVCVLSNVCVCDTKLRDCLELSLRSIVTWPGATQLLDHLWPTSRIGSTDDQGEIRRTCGATMSPYRAVPCSLLFRGSARRRRWAEPFRALLDNPPSPVGKDVEEAQELPVNPARGRHDAGQKGVSSARSVGIGVTIPRHLGARPRSRRAFDIRVAQLPVAAHVREVVAAGLVDVGNINHHIPTIIEVDILDDNNLGRGGASCLMLSLFINPIGASVGGMGSLEPKVSTRRVLAQYQGDLVQK